MKLGRIGLAMLALFWQAGLVFAADRPAFDSKNSFGIAIGKELSLPDCLTVSSDTTCIYPDYASHVPGESEFLRVYVPKAQLPLLAEDGSVRLRKTSKGVVDTVRYSFYGKDAREGAELALTMIRLFGEGHYTFENLSKLDKNSSAPRAFKVMWAFSDSIVSGVCQRMHRDEAKVTVDITAKLEGTNDK